MPFPLPAEFAKFRSKMVATYGERALDALVAVTHCPSCGAVSSHSLGANFNCGFPSFAAFREAVPQMLRQLIGTAGTTCPRCAAPAKAGARYHTFLPSQQRDLVAVVDSAGAVELSAWDPVTSATERAESLDGDEEQRFVRAAALREAHAAFEMNDIDRGVGLVERLMQRFPGDASLIFLVGPLLAAGFARIGAAICAEHVKRAPEDAEGHYWSGEVLFRCMVHDLEPRSRAPEALASLEHALGLRPDDVRALLTLSTLLNATGDADRALAGYERLLALQPDHAQAHYNAGAILLQRDPAKALAHFIAGEKLEPNDPDYHLGCARALIKLDRKMEARWSFERGERLAPNHPKLAEIRADLGA